jgi:hypothetical protein
LGIRGSELSDRPTVGTRKAEGMFGATIWARRAAAGKRARGSAPFTCYTFDTDSEAVSGGDMRALRCQREEVRASEEWEEKGWEERGRKERRLDG